MFLVLSLFSYESDSQLFCLCSVLRTRDCCACAWQWEYIQYFNIMWTCVFESLIKMMISKPTRNKMEVYRRDLNSSYQISCCSEMVIIKRKRKTIYTVPYQQTALIKRASNFVFFLNNKKLYKKKYVCVAADGTIEKLYFCILYFVYFFINWTKIHEAEKKSQGYDCWWFYFEFQLKTLKHFFSFAI